MKPDKALNISIVTVVKDDLRGLRQTAKSIIEQSQNPMEWIIVDGESGPEMSKYLESLSDFPFIQTSTAPPKGIYNAMNRATETASGEWLWFINAGDVLINFEVIENLKRTIPGSEDFGIVATPVIQTTPSGYFYSFTSPTLQRTTEKFVANFHHQGCLIKRDKFRETGGYDEELELAADGKLLESIAESSQVMILDSPLVVFQLGGRSWKYLRKTLEEIDTYRVSRQTHLQRNVTVFKNSLRVFVLPVNPGFLVRKYLEHRQKVLFDKNPWEISAENVDAKLKKVPRFVNILNTEKFHNDI
jgi:glycosyltransferase involved in cell wall biosynthesis